MNLSSRRAGEVEPRMNVDRRSLWMLQVAFSNQTSKKGSKEDWMNDWTRLNERSNSSERKLLSRLEVASFSNPFTAFVLAKAAGLTIDRVPGQTLAPLLPPAAAPQNGAFAPARTKAVLRNVSDVGQRSATDASLFHCIAFRHVMLLSWFILGLLCAGIPGGTVRGWRSDPQVYVPWKSSFRKAYPRTEAC